MGAQERESEKNKTGARVRVTSPQRTILCVHNKREGAKGFHTKQRFHLQRDTLARHGRARSRGFQVDLQHATFAQVEIFKLCRDIRVMTANQRSTAWPLSDVRNVTANRFSTCRERPTVPCSAVRGEPQHGGESDCCRLRLPELYIE